MPVTPVRRRRDRIWLHVVLFFATVATTALVGQHYYLNYVSDVGGRRFVLAAGRVFVGGQWHNLLLGGLWYSLAVLLILGTHELGHYLTCRHYGVSASLPYFLPLPLFPSGTLGAVIRIREPLRTKRQLFDMAIAGPIAGFLVALPVMVVGFAWSRVVRLSPALAGGFEFGDPLLFRLASWVRFGTIPEGYTLALHPLGFAAWFGFLATAFNLLPFWQLDGGHVSYAVFGRRSKLVSQLTAAVTIALTFVSTSWLVWAVIMTVVLLWFRAQHPPTVDEHVPLDVKRRWLAVAALAMLILSFTPVPLTLIGR